MTILILLATSTRTGIIATYLGAYTNRLLLHWRRIVVIIFIGRIVIASSVYLFLIGLHLAHIGLLLTAFADLSVTLLLNRNVGMAQEADDIFIYIAVHLPEQVKCSD